MIQIHGHPISTCTRKVLTVLAEKGAEYELVRVELPKGEHKAPAHTARQPFGQIPVLVHEGWTLYESRAIARYLDAVLPGPRLTPADPRQRARMEQWISVETSNFTPQAMKIIYQLVFGRWRGAEPDMAKVEEGRKGSAFALDVLARTLSEQPYLVGEDFTLADLTFMPYLAYLAGTEEAPLILERPAVADWWARLSGRPSWQQVIALR